MTDDSKSKTKPATSLIIRNLPWLAGVLLANAAVFVVLMKTNALTVEGLGGLVKEWKSLLPAGLSAAVVVVLTGLLSDQMKARLVFWKWRYPLPGSEAFTVHGPKHDDIVNMDALKRKWTLPIEPKDQNLLWYHEMYQTVDDKPSVLQAHQNFLFCRDYATLSFFFVFLLGGLGFWMIPSRTVAVVYLAGLVIQYLIVRQAAKTYGIQFVVNVLALKSAGR